MYILLQTQLLDIHRIADALDFLQRPLLYRHEVQYLGSALLHYRQKTFSTLKTTIIYWCYEKFVFYRVMYLLQISLDQVKEDELGRACGMHGRGEKSVQGFGGKAQRKDIIRKTKA
jgi:hypothetical protein